MTSQNRSTSKQLNHKNCPTNPHLVTIYVTLVVAFVALLLISNISATKLVAINVGSFQAIFDGGAILFPFTYALSTVLAEVFGFKKARHTIYMGFIASIVASLVFLLVQTFPHPREYAHQEAFNAVLGFVPRIVAASLAAYLIGQLLNAYVLVKIKKRFGERKLWVRLLCSTVVAQAVDTLVFATIAFYGVLVGTNFWNYVLFGYAYKVMFEVTLFPFVYLTIKRIQRSEERWCAEVVG